MHTELTFGTWSLFGQGTFVDLIAATTNALNGALLARRPDHYRNYTFVGIVLMAIIGGIAGGVIRDVILGQAPSAFINPAYITFCLIAGIIGYFLAYARGQLFREGAFQFMTSFSLPWYAIIGAQKAIEAGYPILGALAMAVIAPTAGRYLIDVTSGVTPKQFVRGEWFVATAIGTGLVWILLDEAGVEYWISVTIAFLVGFVFRVLALYLGWEEPLAREPKGLKVHSDRRPLLGRKLAGKSQEELRMLGLNVDDGN
ncbi:trimeric intracellular cation channel family protein [Humibacter soli]